MTTNERYNGWTNHSTWNFHLWLTNEEFTYRLVAREARISTVDELSDWLSENATGLLANAGCTDDIELDEINYSEVADAFQE